jgi:hypothetical protein
LAQAGKADPQLDGRTRDDSSALNGYFVTKRLLSIISTSAQFSEQALILISRWSRDEYRPSSN